MTYEQALEKLTSAPLDYGYPSARGLLHAAQQRGFIADGAITVSAIRNPDRWFITG
jgi:hypothetical protein